MKEGRMEGQLTRNPNFRLTTISEIPNPEHLK